MLISDTYCTQNWKALFRSDFKLLYDWLTLHNLWELGGTCFFHQSAWKPSCVYKVPGWFSKHFFCTGFASVCQVSAITCSFSFFFKSNCFISGNNQTSILTKSEQTCIFCFVYYVCEIISIYLLRNGKFWSQIFYTFSAFYVFFFFWCSCSLQ